MRRLAQARPFHCAGADGHGLRLYVRRARPRRASAARLQPDAIGRFPHPSRRRAKLVDREVIAATLAPAPARLSMRRGRTMDRCHAPDPGVSALRTPGRANCETFGEQSAGEVRFSRSLGGGDQRLRDEIALRVAAADANDLVANGKNEVDDAAIFSLGEGQCGLDDAPADIDSDIAIVARSVFLVAVERTSQAPDPLPVLGARYGKRNMQVVEDQHVVIDMGEPLLGERAPTFADIGAGEFETP